MFIRPGLLVASGRNDLKPAVTAVRGRPAASPALAARAEALGARIVRTYGSSETAGGCVYDGVPLDGVRVRTVDGELQLGGPTLADGYLDAPELTADVFVEDGGERWYRTGDAGAFVDGVKIGSGSRSPSTSPAGRGMPLTAPVDVYSPRPPPVR